MKAQNVITDDLNVDETNVLLSCIENQTFSSIVRGLDTTTPTALNYIKKLEQKEWLVKSREENVSIYKLNENKLQIFFESVCKDWFISRIEENYLHISHQTQKKIAEKVKDFKDLRESQLFIKVLIAYLRSYYFLKRRRDIFPNVPLSYILTYELYDSLLYLNELKKNAFDQPNTLDLLISHIGDKDFASYFKKLILFTENFEPDERTHLRLARVWVRRLGPPKRVPDMKNKEEYYLRQLQS